MSANTTLTPFNPSVFDLGFDPLTTTPVEIFERPDPIPNGVYRAKVTSAVRKPTKQCPNCYYRQLDFTVDGGEYDGRTIPARFNIVHTKSEVMEIGRGQLRHYLDCIGNLSPQSEADLCGIPVWITVITKRSPYTDANGKEREGLVNAVHRVDPLVARSEQDASEPAPF